MLTDKISYRLYVSIFVAMVGFCSLIASFYIYKQAQSGAQNTEASALGLNITETLENVQTTVTFTNKSTFVFDCLKRITYAGGYAYADGFLPVHAKQCVSDIKSNKSRMRKAVIWLHGGPFAGFDDQINSLKALYLSKGYTLYEPDYIGTQERELVSETFNGTPKNLKLQKNINNSLDEISAFTRVILSKYDRVDFFGESFGGFLTALYVSQHGSNIPKMRFIFYKMLSTPPKGRIISSKSLFFSDDDFRKSTNVIFNDTVMPFHEAPIKFQNALLESMLASYFADKADIDPMKMLSAIHYPNLYFIAGGKDHNVCSKCIVDMTKNDKTKHLLFFPDSGHNEPESRAQLDQLALFLFPPTAPPQKQ